MAFLLFSYKRLCTVAFGICVFLICFEDIRYQFDEFYVVSNIQYENLADVNTREAFELDLFQIGTTQNNFQI